MYKYCFIFLILVGLVFAQEHILIEYAAIPNHSKIFISWKVSDETNIKQFDILRSNDDKNFVKIKSVKANGSLEYTLYDGSLGKPTQTIYYIIQIIGKNNQILEKSQSLPVNPNFSQIKTTWGAIKAMFR